MNTASPSTHSVTIGRILWIFGFTGAHRFYFGKRKSGLMMALLAAAGPFTAGILWVPLAIWWLLDFFFIGRMDASADGRYTAGPLDYTVAWLLLTFLGMFGAHRLYQGKIITGIIYMLTGGFFLIGWFYDFWTLNSQVSATNARLSGGS